MSISVIVPAYNECGGISNTLEHINIAKNYLRGRDGTSVEILVVDNGSTDRTGEVAKDSNARVIQETVRSPPEADRRASPPAVSKSTRQVPLAEIAPFAASFSSGKTNGVVAADVVRNCTFKGSTMNHVFPAGPADAARTLAFQDSPQSLPTT